MNAAIPFLYSDHRPISIAEYIEDITRPHMDTNFSLSVQLDIVLRYRVEHEKIKFISTSGHVIFC